MSVISKLSSSYVLSCCLLAPRGYITRSSVFKPSTPYTNNGVGFGLFQVRFHPLLEENSSTSYMLFYVIGWFLDFMYIPIRAKFYGYES